MGHDVIGLVVVFVFHFQGNIILEILATHFPVMLVDVRVIIQKDALVF